MLWAASAVGPARADTGPMAPSRLVGLWGADRVFVSLRHGEVAVRRSADVLHAKIGNEETLATPSQDGGFVFRFGDDGGELRTTSFRANRPEAMWIQPATITTGVRYATPVQLLRNGSNAWRGTISPKDDRLEIYLVIGRAPSGSLNAFFRDPLANVGVFDRVRSVVRRGNSIDFTTRSGRLRGTLHANSGTLSLSLPQFAATLTFTRRNLQNAQGFYARRAPITTSYRKPAVENDGWDVARASAVGLDEDALATLVARLSSSKSTALSSPYLQSVTVARHGKLVLDEYFYGFDQSTLHDTRSAGKTYADLLTGVAQFRGAPIDDRTPLLSLFPQYTSLANDDPRKRMITVGNALSMSTGLDCDDNDDSSTGNEDAMQSQTVQNDWYKLVLDAKMVRNPGTKAVYCSASINLVGGAIVGATHQWLPLFFQQTVAAPLQMQRYALNLTPTGEMYLGGGAYVRPRDFMKLGQVFLDGGTWQGRRLMSADWVARSWRPILSLGANDDYGYAWHILRRAARGRLYDAYEAQGNGGQILEVLPQLDLTIMITAGNYQNYETWGPMRDDIVKSIIEAISR
ncbi:MAG: serine hydrolase [Candidatus Eremiobacteraeota bacterium]|nr:serine hydrolase [Candidatus Eremiobacteraeota bacterium]